MRTWHIHIKGQVQGVGFRPHVFLLAREFEIPGWVNNDLDGVHIECNASEQQAKLFYQAVIKKSAFFSTYYYHKNSKDRFKTL